MKGGILTVLLFGFTCSLAAQLYQPKQIRGSIGMGFGLGKGEVSIEPDSADAVLPGLINVTLGYMINDRIGAEVRMERNGYLVNDEDSARVNSMNYLIGPSVTLINNENFGLRASGLIGFSGFNWESEVPEEQANNVHVHGTGMSYQVNVHGDVGISGPVGFFFEAGLASFQLNELTSHDDSMDPSEEVWVDNMGTVDENDDEPVTFSSTQGTVRIGLTVRF
jgi:hypothetical protein